MPDRSSPLSSARPRRVAGDAASSPRTDDGNSSDTARPFLKWAGGKRQLLAAITPYLPPAFGTYHEPFLGGGALFFHLRPPHASLSDGNARLVRAYRGVRDAVSAVVERLRAYPHNKEHYLDMRRRAADHDDDDAAAAAWLIYVNKTGYNGLYRVNRRDEFNVPFGSYRNPTICDEPNLRACSSALRDADLTTADFAHVLDRARRGDFVYFDPPYVPNSASASFTAYTPGGFSLDDQKRLRDVALALKKRGVAILLSNSATPAVYELYRRPFTVVPVSAARAINCRPGARGHVGEVLIR